MIKGAAVDAEHRRYRPGIVGAGRALGVLGIVLGAGQLAVSIVTANRWLLVVGAFQLLCWSASAGIHWFRPAETRIDAEGLSVRSTGGAAQRVAWTEVVEVRPQGSGHPAATAHLRDGRTWTLPGVPQPVARRLAARDGTPNPAAG